MTCRTDDVGIVRLTDLDEPWGDVPAHVVEATLQSGTADALVDRMLDGPHPWPVTLQRRLLHPASGAAASLVPTTPGAVALDLGTGWASLPGALDSFGVRVSRADWVYPRLRFNQLMHPVPAAPAVHLRRDGALPWADGTFDLVFVDLGELGRASSHRSDSGEVQHTMLVELQRVLKEGGTAVIGTSRQPITVPGRGPSRARRAAGPRGRTPVDRRAWGRSPGDEALRRAGLRTRRVVVPYPSRARLKWLIPEERLRDHLWRVASPSATKRMVARLLCATRSATLLVPDFYLIAQRTGTTSSPEPTLGDVILRDEGDRSPVSMALTDARVAVVGTREFAKVPLSSSQQTALVDELEKTALARTTAFAPYVVPSGRLADRHGVPYCVYPLITEGHARPAEVRGVVDAALRGLDPSAVAPLRTTECWRRLAGERGRDDAEEMGATTLRAMALKSYGDAVLPVGPTHGDLHAGNVLVPVAGHALLVDWNRFELNNPLLLDGVYAAVRNHMAAHPGMTLADGLLAFVDDRIPGPLAERARQLTGDLAPLQAATIVLLDRVVSYSLPRRRYKPWTMPPFQQACEALRERSVERPS